MATNKKCTFAKLGTRKLPKRERSRKAMTPNERIKALSDWRRSW